MDIFSERLKQLREHHHKIQQIELAEAVGVGRTRISNLENGRSPDGETLVALAQYFDVSTDYLLGLTPDKKPQGDAFAEGIQTLATYTAKLGYQPINSELFMGLLRHMIHYLRSNPTIGELPLTTANQILTSYTELLAALAHHSPAVVIDKTNKLSAALMACSQIALDYVEYKAAESEERQRE